MRINLNKDYFWGGVIFLLICLPEAMMFTTNSNPVYIKIKYIVIIGITIMLALRWIGKKTYTCSYSFVICLVMCMFVLLTGLINNDLTGGYFYKCSILLLSILFTKAIGFEKFAILFEKIIYSLAIISIICFILASINKDLFSFFPILVNSKGNRFYNLLFDIIPINTSMRNFGIFREPGVYICCLPYTFWWSKTQTYIGLCNSAYIYIFYNRVFSAFWNYRNLYFTKKSFEEGGDKKNIIRIADLCWICCVIYVY